jgi:hypothetical protein
MTGVDHDDAREQVNTCLVGGGAQQFAHALDPRRIERRDLFRPNHDLGARIRQTEDRGRVFRPTLVAGIDRGAGRGRGAIDDREPDRKCPSCGNGRIARIAETMIASF